MRLKKQTRRGGACTICVVAFLGTALWAAVGQAVERQKRSRDARELYTMAPDGSQVTQVTQHGGGVEFVAWSPDGRRIAYGWRGTIQAVDPDGSHATMLVDGVKAGFTASEFRWSPDGKRTAHTFTDAEGRQELRISGDRQQAPETGVGYDIFTESASGTWSADGTLIAFESQQAAEEDRGIYLYDLSRGGARQRISSSIVEGHQPVWSPVGKMIAYVSASEDIHLIAAEWVRERKTPARARHRWLSWASDGTQLTFVCGSDDHAAICVMDVGTLEIKQLTDHAGYGSRPTWSPAGQRILFLADGVITAINGDGSQRHALTEEDLLCSDMAWSPDGSKIAFVGMPGRLRLRGTSGE